MKKIVMYIAFFLLFSPLITVSAQQPDDWYVNKPISDIRFIGLQNIDETELDAVVDQYIGENFTDQLFIELQSSLYALDYFDIFTPNAVPGDENNSSIIIEFEVIERPIVDKIEIRGNSNIRDGELLDVVLLKPDDIVNKTKVQLDAEAIKELYIERGYPSAVVEGDIVIDREENTAVVTFDITEGSQTRIREIAFSGNTFASDTTLIRVMDTKVQSLFSKGIFQESQLEQDLRNIESYYWENGYIDARVVDTRRVAQIDEDSGHNYLVLTIYIEEGEQYIFGGYELDGNSLFSTEELLEVTLLKEGDVLDKNRMEADFLRMSDIYYNEGYIYNQISRQEVRDAEDNVVSYEISIIERGRAHIENIIVQGNDKTKDIVILRELPFETGDVFSKEKIMEGLQNLYNTGLFSAITPNTPMGSVEGLMDLIVTVEEAKTIDLNFGVTFSGDAGDFPVLGFLKWTDRNFLGMGNEVSASAELSGTTQQLTFSYSQDWLFGRRWSWGADFSISHDLEESIAQDILSPVFSADDSNKVPDPYEGYYVFSEDTEYDGTTYEAGAKFPGVPTAGDIDTYDLVTDYVYSGYSLDSDYLMSYHSVEFSLGANTGYQWHTGIGRFGLSTGLRTSLEFLTYDDTLYRPYNVTTRNNLNSWLFANKIWANAQWDTRDYIQNPTKGFNLNQNFQYVGGVLFGSTHFMRTSSKAEVFFTLFDIPVVEAWSWKLVLALHSDFIMLLPQYRRGDDGWGWGRELRDDDFLYVDSMQVARGWGYQTGGTARWNNWIELRMPILEQFLWWDFFFSGTTLWEDNSDILDMNLDDFMFTFGGGIRLTVPGFPMGFYIAKRFRTNNGAVEWQSGNIGGDTSWGGLDFVISFTYEIF